MKKDEFQSVIKNEFETIKTLTNSKGEEYSRSDDQLANFKRNAANLGMLPEQVWSVYFNKHIDSINFYIAELAKGKEPKLSESIESRISDAILYLLLFKAMVSERS